jgi:hypothetical protein
MIATDRDKRREINSGAKKNPENTLPETCKTTAQIENLTARS